MSIKDIETILDTLRFDGKLEMTLVNDTSAGSSRPGEYNQKKLYKAVKPILTSTGLVRVPCGVCPVRFSLFFPEEEKVSGFSEPCSLNFFGSLFSQNILQKFQRFHNSVQNELCYSGN